MNYTLPSYLFGNSVTLTKYAAGQDAEGGYAPTVPSTTTGVACSVQPTSGRGMIDQGRDGEMITHKVYFRSDQSLAKGDTITWGTKLLSVKDTYNATSGVDLYYRADCTERQ